MQKQCALFRMIKIFQTNRSYDKSELLINTFIIIVNNLKEKEFNILKKNVPNDKVSVVKTVFVQRRAGNVVRYI